MRLSRRPLAHRLSENRAFRQTAQVGFLAITIGFRSRKRERIPHGIFDTQEAIGFDRISQQARQAATSSKWLETHGYAALEEGACW